MCTEKLTLKKFGGNQREKKYLEDGPPLRIRGETKAFITRVTRSLGDDNDHHGLGTKRRHGMILQVTPNLYDFEDWILDPL